jgi:hypothetical protein
MLGSRGQVPTAPPTGLELELNPSSAYPRSPPYQCALPVLLTLSIMSSLALTWSHSSAPAPTGAPAVDWLKLQGLSCSQGYPRMTSILTNTMSYPPVSILHSCCTPGCAVSVQNWLLALSGLVPVLPGLHRQQGALRKAIQLP